MAAVLKNRYDVITQPPIVRLVRNLVGRCKRSDWPMTIHTSKSKPKIEFQYGGRPFSKTGNSFISLKFGMQIDFYFPKQMPSLNLNLEVDFRLYGRHLKTSIRRYNSGDFRLITTKFGRQKFWYGNIFWLLKQVSLKEMA